MIVPTRARPASVWRLIQAWIDTGAFDDGAQLVFAADRDDPQWEHYRAQADAPGVPAGGAVYLATMSQWQPMVYKLDEVAREVVGGVLPGVMSPFAVGFAGDDHVPRTAGWAGRFVAELRGMGTGIVYGDDGYQGENIPTYWVMTSDIVRALGRMVPAPVTHLYCDNAIKELGEGAGCLRYLPDVLVEHLNPYADGKCEMDEQYRKVNSTGQYRQDGRHFQWWRRHQKAQHVAAVTALRSAARQP